MAGANLIQTTEPTIAIAVITIDIDRADMPDKPSNANIIIGGSEPHVPGAIGK